MAVALLAAAMFFVWQSTQLPFGHVGLPGPGFFPSRSASRSACLPWRSSLAPLGHERQQAVYLGTATC
jgi:hypothetical protein